MFTYCSLAILSSYGQSVDHYTTDKPPVHPLHRHPTSAVIMKREGRETLNGERGERGTEIGIERGGQR